MSERSNQDWLEELRGARGLRKQKLAHEELGIYLYDKARDYLMHKHVYGNPYALDTQSQELLAWPQQVAQETREKVADNNFALLKAFESRFMSDNEASFLNWAASIVVFEELRGECGSRRQEFASQNLAAYLYDTVYYYLRRRQAKANPYVLANFAADELAGLAMDFVQNTHEKVVRDDCAVLDTFKAKARFTTWLAKIVINEARRELRRPYWEKRTVSTQDEGQDASLVLENLMITEKKDEPEGKIIDKEHEMKRSEIENALNACLKKLTPDQRVAILGKFFEGRSGKELAKELARSRNAVFLLIRQAKRNLRKCLERGGWEGNDV